MDDKAEVALVWKALLALARENKVWNRNVEVFQVMDDRRRLWHWAHAQKQAALGVPAMQALVAEVIKQRLIG